jgi:hypothetical protein
MSLMVEESKSVLPVGSRNIPKLADGPQAEKGSVDIMIHGFSSSHGDPFVGAFAERLLSSVTTILRYVTSVDLRRRIVRSLS